MTTQVNKYSIEIWTEGKTDWMHMKKASEKLGISFPIAFHEYESDMGDRELKRKCETFAERYNLSPIIFIFDRDDANLVREIEDPSKAFKSWGNNVFSFAIPVPSHRQGYENISIEHYYRDEELQTKDAQGRRLFLSSEFNENSGRHKLDPSISVGNKGKLKHITEPYRAKIIGTDVYDGTSQNIALSKSDFATYVLTDIAPFDSFDFEEFNEIFDIIQSIFQVTRPYTSIYLPNLYSFFKDIAPYPEPGQLGSILEMTRNVLALNMEIFVITTIRVYENEIINEPDKYRKKARSVKKILRENFRKPSLKNIYDIAQKCSYLIDENAPESLHKMKICFEAAFVLEDIGQLLDDLERLFPPKAGTAIQMNKAKIQRDLFNYVIPELLKYLRYSQDEIEEAIRNSVESFPSVYIWQNALLQLIKIFEPVLTSILVFRQLASINPRTGSYIVAVKTFSSHGPEQQELKITAEEAEEYESNISELQLTDSLSVHLFPFLLIKDDALYFYQRTLGSGYEYYSIIDDRVHIERTKKKFNHAVFKTGSKQELFWTDVLPTENPQNGIKANIPDEGLEEFVGRKRQIRKIIEEIIEIPNQNGIVYGPGGIGKTALMLELSQELFNEIDPEKIYFENIIWVSAKSNYYDYIFDAIEKREQQIRSLEEILLSILQFFEFEGLEEYDFEDKKELVLEILADNSVLLVLDNFETVAETEAQKIVRFFGIDVKKRLKQKPDYFKVIITSRKQIPSGFHQIELKGLDFNESRQLMTNLHRRYRTKMPFSETQEEELYKATKGIPIVIKHCFGKIFEYNKPFNSVIRGLYEYANEVVQFSFNEILEQIEKKDKSGIQLRVLLLLELTNYPLMIRQIADILEVEEYIIENGIPRLIDFQCLSRISQNNQEKYIVNDEIRLLTRSLASEHAELVREIRQKITSSSVDKQMDYTAEELDIVGLFEMYLTEKEYLEAEDFIRDQLRGKPHSILLNYHYARYLKDNKREYERAIDILEKIREPSKNHLSVLRLLFSCYMSLDIPNFDRASIYVNDLESYLSTDPELRLQVADFYVKWSTSIKLKRELDALEEKIRQERYKTLADKALSILERIPNRDRDDKVFYLLAQSHFNQWNYDTALKMIERAIKLTSEKSWDSAKPYEYFKRTIQDKKDRYSRGHQWG